MYKIPLSDSKLNMNTACLNNLTTVQNKKTVSLCRENQ